MEKLKKILKGVWEVLNSRLFLFGVIVLLFMYGLTKCSNMKDLKIDNARLEQNISAANDTIDLYKTKTGALQAEKEVFIKSEKELKKENSDLYKRIRKQEGDIISLNRAIVRFKQNEKMLNDSINTLNKIIGAAVQVDNNTWMIPWELNYDWDPTNHDYFEGQTFVSVDTNPDGTFKLNPDGTLNVKHDDTKLLNRDTQIDLEFGEKVVDGKYHVYIQTKYPGFTAQSLDGVFIDPNTNKDIQSLIKKKHWFTGFSFSISVTAGYDPIGQKPALVVGPSLNYNIYSW
jgi:hypothetical protein